MTEEENASMANSHSSNGPVQNLSDDSFIAITYIHPIILVHWFPRYSPANNLVCGSLLYFTNAFDIWEELKIRYLRSDGPRVFSLEKSLSSISQNSKSIIEYFSEFKALWDEYISYRPIPSCRCGNLNRCSCNILKDLTDRQQSDYVMKFLVGLHDSYSAIRSQLLLQSPLPSMSRVFSLLLQEESQRSLTNAVGISIDSQAMVAEQSSRTVSTSNTQFTKQKGKSDAICSHCGYSGHLVDKYSTLHQLQKKFQRLPTANNTNVLEQNSSNSNMIFSQEQIQNLLTLANSLSSSNTNSNATANVASTSGPQQMKDDWAC
ncbi:hypothetical protein AAG906_010709 [Vitis piasezkii]